MSESSARDGLTARWEFVFKKVACLEPYPIRQPLLGHKLLECRLNLRKIETDPAEMSMRARQSDRRHALRGADIHETLIIVPALPCEILASSSANSLSGFSSGPARAERDRVGIAMREDGDLG